MHGKVNAQISHLRMLEQVSVVAW